MLATTRAIERTNAHLYTYVDGTKRYGPFPGATALCRVQDSLGGTDGLMTWGINLALDEFIAKWGGANLEEARAAAIRAKDVPRDEGTAVHSAVDRFNKDEPLALTPTTAPYVAHYAAALRREGIDVLASERYVVNPDIGFGGTYDSLVRIGKEAGPLDVKTGREKASQRIQLTLLSMGQWHGEAGLEAEPMPVLSNVGWILLLRPDGYELIRHDITDEDRAHAIHLVETYHRIRDWASSYMPTALQRKEAA
jgi:hypothetical protein